MWAATLHRKGAASNLVGKEKIMKNSVLSRIGELFGDLGRSRAARDTYLRLDALSDRALAARGLKRTDLAAKAVTDAFGK
jgi:hypothetical protein